MASVFLYHVVGDLTVGKPEMAEFFESESVESAIRAIGESTEGGIAVWKKRSAVVAGAIENTEMRQQRFVGILNSLDIVAFFARNECLEDREKALKTPVSEVIVRNNSVLRQVDPATRLIDALEMMKNGVKRLLVRKSVVWKGMSKRFSILYNGKWLKNMDGSSGSLVLNPNRPSSSTKSPRDKFCCLSREDILRFIIGCLGALAPLPLSSISVLGAINPNYHSIEASCPAVEATQKLPEDPSAVAVVERTNGNQYRVIGEISASRLWKCDLFAAAWALANLSAGQFVMGVEDNMSAASSRSLLPDSPESQPVGGENNTGDGAGPTRRQRSFSSRSIGFNPGGSSFGNMYRGRSAPLTCKVTSSLAAVMAQMLSHRVTHVWVVDDDMLVGVVGYADIMAAVSKPPASVATANRSYEGLVNEIQS